jgi:transposase
MDKFLELVSPALRKLPHPLVRTPLEFLLQQIRFLLEQEKVVDAALEEMVRNDPRIARLRSIPGVGPVGSIALAAVIDDIGRFPDAKHFASYLGLVPQEHSSGNKRMMGSITRSGSELVRRYLIHGARAVLLHTSPETKDENRRWALKLKDKIGQNKATVALAHRMARIAWSVLKNERDYTTERPPASRVA